MNDVHPAVHETLKLGGPLGKSGLAKLWVAEGGNPAKANLAASVALAESSGMQHSTDNDSNGTVDRGYWQINSVHGAQSTYDPVGNVRAAIAISRNGEDFSPWVTYNSGAYKQYLGQPIGNLGSPRVSLPGRSRGGAGTTTTTTSGGQPDVSSAGIAALLSSANKPIDTSGKVSASDPLSAFANNIASGNFTTPVTTSTKTVRLPRAATPAAPAKGDMSFLKTNGVSNYAGKQVADWIVPILQYAKAHGWAGSVNSGYRSFAEQKAIYDSGVRPAAVPGTSNHEMKAYPGGAVDVSEAQQLSSILAKSPYKGILVWAGSKDPVHFSHPHNGSY